jgi:hypothetical protein
LRVLRAESGHSDARAEVRRESLAEWRETHSTNSSEIYLINVNVRVSKRDYRCYRGPTPCGTRNSSTGSGALNR